jgi:hypothetical protein
LIVEPVVNGPIVAAAANALPVTLVPSDFNCRP